MMVITVAIMVNFQITRSRRILLVDFFTFFLFPSLPFFLYRYISFLFSK